MIRKFIDFVHREHLFQKNDRILIAVSGGMDSVVMTHLFQEAGFQFAVAHCNFQLRGKESDEDEKSVKSLAEKFGVDFFCEHFDTTKYAEQKKISIQMAARDLRFEWLEKIRRENKLTSIALAHHLNDSIETVFLNLTRGTGIAGLHGILPKHERLIHPLLCFTRDEIKNFAEKNKIDFREDSSNISEKYLRNKIRHSVIPVLKEINPDLEKTFEENFTHFRDAETIYQFAIQKLKQSLIENEKGILKIPILKLQLQPAYASLLFELIRDFGFNKDQVTEIVKCLNEQSGKIFLTEKYRLIKDRKFLFIEPHPLPLSQGEGSGFVQIEETIRNISFNKLHLHLRQIESKTYNMSHSKEVGEFDLEKIQFPLTIRFWKKGDYFYPLGLGKRNNPDKPGKKKLSDYLTDLKLPLHEKERIVVLLSGEHLIWVIGHRIDERFKVSEKTKKILRIELKNKS